MLIAHRRNEAVVVAATVLLMTGRALILKDGLAQLQAPAVTGLRETGARQRIQEARQIGPRLLIGKLGLVDDGVHLATRTLLFAEVRQLLHQIRSPLTGQRRNHPARAAERSLAVTLGAVSRI